MRVKAACRETSELEVKGKFWAGGAPSNVARPFRAHLD